LTYLLSMMLSENCIIFLLYVTQCPECKFFCKEDLVYIILTSGVQCIYHLREAHEIFVTGVEFAPSTVSHAVVGPNVDFTLFSISADSQIKAHQLASRRMLLLLCSFAQKLVYFLACTVLLFPTTFLV